MSNAHPEPKTCPVCGRRIEWRKKWEKDWENVVYCSQQCRRNGLKDIDRQLEEAILELLQERSKDATICPGEAARLVRPPGEDRQDESRRELMEQARRAARRLAAAGRIDILQKGKPADPSTAKGPIRLKLRG